MKTLILAVRRQLIAWRIARAQTAIQDLDYAQHLIDHRARALCRKIDADRAVLVGLDTPIAVDGCHPPF